MSAAATFADCGFLLALKFVSRQVRNQRARQVASLVAAGNVGLRVGDERID
jgi:hypothetical protein